jgi:hypothetical protein
MSDFKFPYDNRTFYFAIADSLFTHLLEGNARVSRRGGPESESRRNADGFDTHQPSPGSKFSGNPSRVGITERF